MPKGEPVMKFAIARQDLLDAVNKVKTVVSQKSALPILSHILIQAEEGVLRLTATDLKVSIECQVDCSVHEPGSMTVHSARLASILSELPECEIQFTLGENSIIALDADRIHTKLFSMSPDEFPPIRSFEGVEPLVLSQGLLRSLFEKTSFAVCNDQARYNLTGLLFEIGEGSLTVVATDGRRMSLCIRKEVVQSENAVKVIIPGKMIAELERLLGSDEEVQILIDESQAAFSFGSIRLVSALIEGSFPNYDMVVPKKHDKEVVIACGPFQEAVRRTRTMTNDKFNSVRFHVADGVMTLRVVTPEVGEYQEEMAIEYDGAEVEIAFNPDFVIDVLRHMNTEKVSLVLKDGMSPGMLRPVTDESSTETYINVIMPIRI
jgi:DNA polymerase III subunit beta